MSNDLTAIYSGDVAKTLHLHHYNTNNYDEDIIIIMNGDGQLYYIIIDRKKRIVLEKKTLSYLSKITSLLVRVFPTISSTSLVLDKLFGLYDNKDTGPFNLVTLLFIMKHRYLNTYYVVQMNIKNHDTSNTDISLISGHLNVNNIYLDLMVKKHIIYNDISTIDDTHTYLMFIDVENSSTNSIKNAHIKGLRLLVTNEEKEEFTEFFPDIELPKSYHPIIDIWSKQQVIFMQLTEDTNQISFNFSTGMGFVGFNE